MDTNKEKLEFLTQCALCGSRFLPRDITIISRNEQRAVYHLSCTACLVSSLIYLTRNQGNLLSLGMITDLGKEEVVEKFNRRGITADEVIEVYKLLNG